MRYLTILMAVLVLSSFSNGAAAELANSTDDQAREMFLIGAGNFEEGEYDAAIQAFRLSYQLNPVPTVLYNIAMCHRALLQFIESIETFEQYLAEAGPRAPIERRQEVGDLIRQMERLVGHLQLVGVPPEATVYLNGERIDLPPTGVIRVPPPPETHSLRVTAPNYQDFEMERISAALGDAAQINVVLEPNTIVVTPNRWYRRWWFWTIVGTAVAAGVGVGVGIGMSNANSGVGQGDWDVRLP
jgi:tetratricopeptide (TPR) repeat protein